MARLSDAFIDELLSRIDIVEVIGQRVPLKKQGREFAARCPFHDERSASFTVSPSKQFYHCFGCGAHGSAIGFLMTFDRLEFLDAVEELAQRAGIEIPQNDQRFERKAEWVDLHAIMLQSAEYYHQQLKTSSAAQQYLKNRGLDEATLQHYQVGYAPAGFDALIKKFGTDPARMKLLERGGMLSQNDRGQIYDKFRHRIMFPIADRRGRPIAFGGRVLDPNDKPKYLNSPETELFHKGQTLYGLWQVRQAHSHIPYLLVVEGYMDVVALFQHGIQTAVATLGTATTPDHAELLFRYTETVVFAFDGDRAGKQAATKAADAVIEHMREGRQVFLMFLPDGEDPDSLVRKEGASGFEALREKATPLSEFLIDQWSEGLMMNTLEGRSRFAALAKPVLARLPDGTFADLLKQRVTELSRMPSGSASVSGHTSSTHQSVRGTRQAVPVAKRSLVRSIIGLLLQQPSLALELQPPYAFRDLRMPGISLLVDMLQRVEARPEINTASLLESYADTEHATALEKLASVSVPVAEESMLQEFADAIKQLEQRMLEQRLGELQELQRRDQLTDKDISELFTLLQQKQNL